MSVLKTLLKQLPIQFFQSWPLVSIHARDRAVLNSALHGTNSFLALKKILTLMAQKFGAEYLFVKTQIVRHKNMRPSKCFFKYLKYVVNRETFAQGALLRDPVKERHLAWNHKIFRGDNEILFVCPCTRVIVKMPGKLNHARPIRDIACGCAPVLREPRGFRIKNKVAFFTLIIIVHGYSIYKTSWSASVVQYPIMTWFMFAVLSAFLASLSSIIEKRTLIKVHSTDFSLATALLIALFSIPFFFTGSASAITPKVLIATYIVSLLASLAFLEVTKGVRHMEISASAPLFLLSPFLTALIAYLFLHETLTTMQLFGIGLLALGTYILETRSWGDISGFLNNFFGDKYARLIILGLFFYAITSTIDRVVLGEWGVPALLFVGILHACIFINLSLLFLWQGRSWKNLFRVVGDSWKPLTLISLLTIGYRASYSYAVAMTAVALVISIKRSSSLFTTVIGGQLFHDHALLRKSVACAVMIAGVYFMSLK